MMAVVRVAPRLGFHKAKHRSSCRSRRRRWARAAASVAAVMAALRATRLIGFPKDARYGSCMQPLFSCLPPIREMAGTSIAIRY